MRYGFILLLLLSQLSYAQEIPVPESNNTMVKELFFAGLKEKMAENYANASTNFNKILALDPKNAAAYFELATLSFRQQQLLAAETAIKKAISLDASNIWYLKLQAEIYKRNGNMEALVIVFSQMIQLTPENDNLYFDKANALFIGGQVAEAKKVYTEIEQKFGNSTALTLAKQRITLQDQSGSEEISVDQLLKDNPTDVKNYLYVSGLLLEKNKKEEALRLLQKAKTLEPDNFEVDLAMADIYQSLKQQELAIASLKKAFSDQAMPVENKIKIISAMLPRFNQQQLAKDATELTEITLPLHPNNAKLHMLYGDILYKQGKMEGAKDQYQQAIKISEQLYVAWEKLLGLQTLMGLFTAAIQTGEEALSIYPNQAILHYYLAFALHRNGQNAEAATAIAAALQLGGDDNQLKGMIFALQAEVLIDQEKLKEADIAFDQAIALSPDNYLTLSNYAYYLALRNQNLTKAETLASKAAMALPDNASVLDTYAMVLFKVGKYDLALHWIEKALQNKESVNPVYLEHYGDILFLKGQKETALSQWIKAKNAGNDSEKLIRKINEKKYIK